MKTLGYRLQSLLMMLAIGIASVCWGVEAPPEGPVNERPLEMLVTAPSGAFHVAYEEMAPSEGEKGHQKLWVVSTANPKERTLLCERNSKKNAETPLAWISPDDRLICCLILGAFELFQRTKDAGGNQYEPVMHGTLDDAAWHYFAATEKMAEDQIGKVPERPANSETLRPRGICFVAWSGDASRLLLCLSGSIGPVNAEGDAFPNGVTAWLCYFNTRRSEFELTERLVRFNKNATMRWHPTLRVSTPTFFLDGPLDAEDTGKEGPGRQAQQMFDNADEKLNAIYARLLEKLSPTKRETLREEQRAWLVQRDTEATIRALQSWNPFMQAKVLEGRALATEKRAAELEVRIGRTAPK